MRPKLTTPLLAVSLAASCCSLATDLLTNFTHPPASNRILKIIHGWPDDPTQQDAWRNNLLEQGFGGVVCNVSFQNYLQGETQWTAFNRAVDHALADGMTLWLYDERGYPSATAGGLVLQDHPEWEARGLLIASQTCTGPATTTLMLPPGLMQLAQAYPINDSGIPDLSQPTNLVDHITDHQLRWTPPTGTWQLLAVTQSTLYDGTHAAMNLDAKIPYPNLLTPQPTQRFIELTHAAYADHLPQPLGHYFVSTFTDEPSLMSLFLRPMPYGVLPWDPSLAKAYASTTGHTLLQDLPAIALDQSTDAYRARYQFWQLVGQQVSKNFFGSIQAYCHTQEILSGGHLLMEESLTSQVPLYGDHFACLRRLDAPSIDCLTSLPPEVPWRIARIALSAAILETNQITMCEISDHSQVYRPARDTRPKVTVSEDQIRGTFNRLMAGGINTFTSYYSYTGLNNDALQRLNNWVGRCTLLLQQGEPDAPIAVLLPTESLWPHITPSRGPVTTSAEASEIEKLFDTTCDQLFTGRHDFLCIDTQALLESEIQNGTLSHHQQRWPILILPGIDTLPAPVWQRIQRFVHQGGVLIALGHTPRNTNTQFPSPEILHLSRNLFGPTTSTPSVQHHPSGGLGIYLPPGSEGFLHDVLEPILSPPLKIQSSETTLRLTSRKTPTGSTHFLLNDSDQPWQGHLTTPSTGTWSQWNPHTGTATPITNAPLHLTLAPYSATFLCGHHPPTTPKLNTTTAHLPQLRLTPLQLQPPTTGRGEFVRETVSPSTNIPPAWTATATLTQSQVDTFLFLMFPLPPEQTDWSRSTCLVLPTTTPENQNTASQLLVILKEKSGAEYLASTGRSLGAPGQRTTHLFWNQFQLAGWSTDTNHQLDLNQLAELRVGWGGYYGTENETVEFTLQQPALGSKTNRN